MQSYGSPPKEIMEDLIPGFSSFDPNGVPQLPAELGSMFGGGDEETLNRQSFDLFLKRLRGASLRLNKGTQTEGDAEIALQEIINNRNNTKAVRKALQDLQRANERAVEERKRNINRRRKAQGAEAFSFDDYTTPTTSSDVGFNVID